MEEGGDGWSVEGVDTAAEDTVRALRSQQPECFANGHGTGGAGSRDCDGWARVLEAEAEVSSD